MRIRAALFCSLGLAFRENRREACPRAEENMVAARREKMRAKFVIVSGSASQKLTMATAQRLGARKCLATAGISTSAAFEDEVGVRQNGFQFGQNIFKARPSECGKRSDGRRPPCAPLSRW